MRGQCFILSVVDTIPQRSTLCSRIRVEAQVVSLHHVLAQINADVFCRASAKGMCNGARTTGVVQHTDTLSRVRSGRSLECGGGVEKGDTDPVDVLIDEGVDGVEQVTLPLFR